VVSKKMHAILFDWISQVHTGVQTPLAFDGTPDPQDMLFRTFSHMDAYLLSEGSVQRSELQLSGVACTFAAAGLKEGNADANRELASWLAFVTDGACTPDEVRQASRNVQHILGFKMYQPTAYTFLRRYLRWTGWSEESFSLANYLIELAIVHCFVFEFRPQVVAAAAAVLSRQYFSQGVNVPFMTRWRAKLLRCSHVDIHQELAPCISALAQLHALQHGQENLFVNKKYSWARFHNVARLAPVAPLDVISYAQYLESDSE